MPDPKEPTYLFTPFEGEPGQTFDDWEESLFNLGATIVDERGWSVADHLLRVDEGSPNGPALPAGAIGVKAAALQRKRMKEAYGLITRHITDSQIKTELRTNHFQNPSTALQYLQADFRKPVDALALRDMDKEWDAIDILSDISVNENTIKSLVIKLKALNDERPTAPVNHSGRFAACTRSGIDRTREPHRF